MVPGFFRTTRAEPCPICSEPDRARYGWCLVRKDKTEACCARIQSTRRLGDAGWLHALTETPIVRKPARAEPPLPPINFSALNCQCIEDLPKDDQLHVQLGLSPSSLAQLGLGWHKAHGCWTFPMRDEWRRVIGLRTRYPNGDKLCIRGSRTGLFIPSSLVFSTELWIVEGPTDCAALLDLGLPAVGRPSNTGGHNLLVAMFSTIAVRTIYIVADRDKPGSKAEELTTSAAKRLASACERLGKQARIFRPPHRKDVREWIRAGANVQALRYVAEATREETLT